MTEQSEDLIPMQGKPINEKQPVPAQTEEVLKELAKAMVSNMIFTDLHLHQDPHMIGSVFMPIAFGAMANYDLSTLGLLYEYMDKAMPRSINGYPCFMSVRMLNRDDATKMLEYVKKLEEATAAALA